MLTQKFWRSIAKDGLIRTYQRAHKLSSNKQYIVGHEGLVKCVGMDEFGNKYYEDLSVDHRYHRRWVEYAEHTRTWHMTQDLLPPDWTGWLSGTYEDAPSEGVNFVKHSYIKTKTGNALYLPDLKLPQGFLHAHNPVDRDEFFKTQRDRKSAIWEVLEHEVGLLILIWGTEGGRVLEGAIYGSTLGNMIRYF